VSLEQLGSIRSVAEWTQLGKPQASKREGATWSMAMTAVIALECPAQDETLALLAQSDAYHARLYPAASNHLLPAVELARDNVRFLVARIGGVAVGCGALLIGSDGAAEIKRMFVAPAVRGRQLGRQILLGLEREAEAVDVRVIRLETGVRQPEALALYRSHGYVERGPFGSYRLDPLSTFFEKRMR
jgi:putative acetyltransferase